MKLDVATQFRAAGLPDPVAEYRFHPVRGWLFDWAWPDLMVAAELEGGTWSGGRHTRGRGYAGDCEKYSEAAILGWRVVRFTTEMAEKGKALDLVQRAIQAAKEAKAESS